MARWLAILLALLLAPFVGGCKNAAPEIPDVSVRPGSDREQEQPESRPWEWTPEEEGQIASIEWQVEQNKHGLWEYQQGNYVFKSPVSARFTAEMAVYAGLFENVFNKILGSLPTKRELPESFRMTVTAYDKRPKKSVTKWYENDGFSKIRLIVSISIRQVKRRFEGDVFVYAEDADFSSAANKDLREALQHEMTHVYTWIMIPAKMRVPPFFDEANAHLWERCNMRTYGFNVTAMDEKPRLGLAEYLMMKSNAFYGPGAPLNYMVAYNFGIFMADNPERQKLFKTMLERVFTGQNPLTTDEIRKLEPEWNEWNQWVSETVASQSTTYTQQ